MHGTIKWNFMFGGAGAAIILLVSIPHNVWMTALTRSVYAFVIFFLLAFVIRWWLRSIAPTADSETEESKVEEAGLGNQIDLQTPDDAELTEAEDPFQPMQPPKLASQSEQTPAEMANALRRMSEE